MNWVQDTAKNAVNSVKGAVNSSGVTDTVQDGVEVVGKAASAAPTAVRKKTAGALRKGADYLDS